MIQGSDTRRHLPSLLAISSTTCPRPYPDTGRTGQEAVATTVGDPAQLLDVHVDQIPPVRRVRSGRVWVWQVQVPPSAQDPGLLVTTWESTRPSRVLPGR